MTDANETDGDAPVVPETGSAGLDVRIARELIDQARAEAEHLGYEKGDPAGRGRGNHRNGTSPKTVHAAAPLGAQ